MRGKVTLCRALPALRRIAVRAGTQNPLKHHVINIPTTTEQYTRPQTAAWHGRSISSARMSYGTEANVNGRDNEVVHGVETV
jgi:hypothetical protein